jgi:hypothetical protein
VQLSCAGEKVSQAIGRLASGPLDQKEQSSHIGSLPDLHDVLRLSNVIVEAARPHFQLSYLDFPLVDLMLSTHTDPDLRLHREEQNFAPFPSL